jgi:hypothetical protein
VDSATRSGCHLIQEDPLRAPIAFDEGVQHVHVGVGAGQHLDDLRHRPVAEHGRIAELGEDHAGELGMSSGLTNSWSGACGSSDGRTSSVTRSSPAQS